MPVIGDVRPQKDTEAGAWDSHWAAQVGLIVAGLVALVLGSEYLVQSSVSLAKALGVSDLVIGLTIVAAGTSMPEVATRITVAIEGEACHQYVPLQLEIHQWHGLCIDAKLMY